MTIRWKSARLHAVGLKRQPLSGRLQDGLRFLQRSSLPAIPTTLVLRKRLHFPKRDGMSGFTMFRIVTAMNDLAPLPIYTGSRGIRVFPAY